MRGVAFIFPGSLSVRSGMLRELEKQDPRIGEMVEAASRLAGCDVSRLLRDGPEDLLREDPVATLATVALDVAAYVVLERMGIVPAALAGHGAGFHAAAVAGGVLTLAQALEIASEEQRLGWELLVGRDIAMAEVHGLEERRLEDLLRDLLRNEKICVAAHEGPGASTLAGEAHALDQALGRLERSGCSVQRLPRGLPRHTPFLLGLPARLNAAIGRTPIADPKTPLYSHFDGSIVLRGWQARELVVQQTIHPVRWDQCIWGLVRNGIDTFIEVGPGRRLSDTLQAIEPGARVFSSDGPRSFDQLHDVFC